MGGVFQHKAKEVHSIVVGIKENLFDWSRGFASFHDVTSKDSMVWVCNFVVCFSQPREFIFSFWLKVLGRVLIASYLGIKFVYY